MKRMILVIFAVAVVLVGAAFAFAWYFAGQIERQALVLRPPWPPFDLIVMALGDGEITLAPTAITNRRYSDLYMSGRYGLSSADGDGVVGNIVRRDGDIVTRQLLSFNAPLARGDRVRLRALAYFGDPRAALGLDFDEVTIESDVGPLGAWFIPGSLSTWAIMIHGRGIDRREGLKAVSALEAIGLPTLLIDYRNDDGAPGSASGYYDYGLSEWRDVEAAVRYAVAHGAEDVVLVGFSMGGAIAVSLLYRSEVADRVRGLVLDSPILDFNDVVDYGASRRHVWKGLTWLGKTVAAIRYGIVWLELDYLRLVYKLDVPILLIHGDADRVVPVSGSDRLAEARPDLVTYLRPEGVGHVRAWNVDRAAYEAALADFVKDTLDVGQAPERTPDG